jgi:hypothetical protein
MKKSQPLPLKVPAIVIFYFLAAYCGGLILRNNSEFLDVLSKLPTLLLLFGNACFVLAGVPLSALGDLLLLRQWGLSYLVFWPLFVGLASCLQVMLFRSRTSLLWVQVRNQRWRSGRVEAWLGGSSATLIVLAIRSIPIMPFLAGSYVIANLSSITIRKVLLLSIVGSYLYYGYFGGGYFLGFTSAASHPSRPPFSGLEAHSVPSG